MKRFMLVAALVVAALSMSAVTATTALASSYTPPQCGGKMIVNVTYGLYNDADSGFFGNWAIDSLKRHVQIFDVGGGSFLCARQ